MITLEIQNNNKNRVKQLLKLYKGKHDDLVSAMLQFKINDLKKGIRNIELDLRHFEEKYETDSQQFYDDFIAGNKSDTNDDFIQWSGEYETLLDFKRELELIS